MLEKANAKLNLCLNVKSRREDGYHELEMIMVPLDLHDTLEVEVADKTTLTSNVDMPLDSSNTIIKAIEVMRKYYGFTENFKINVDKKIPMQAGLAGGSSDGAAMLRCINELLHLNLDVETLARIGKEIGADVPFCVYNTPAIVKGIGEKIETFTMPKNYYVLLVKPKEGVSTKLCFESLNLETAIHPDCHALKDALVNEDADEIHKHMQNTLESSAFVILPKIEDIKNELIQYGFPYVLMSGSGSTVFSLSEDKEFVEKAYVKYCDSYDFVVKTQIKL